MRVVCMCETIPHNCLRRLRAQDAVRNFNGKSWWKHVKVLADDKVERRETGSPGERRAQAYVVEQLNGFIL